MFRWITDRFAAPVFAPVPYDAGGQDRAEMSAAELSTLEKDPYLMVADLDRRIISVFDDLRYDRSDVDMMAGPMRRRVAQTLAPMGFRQVTGSILEDCERDIRMHIPKFRAGSVAL